MTTTTGGTMDTMAAEVLERELVEWVPTGKDRCDQDGGIAQAYVKVVLPNGHDLLFCGHHYAQAEARIAGMGATIFDARALLEPKPYDPETDNV